MGTRIRYRIHSEKTDRLLDIGLPVVAAWQVISRIHDACFAGKHPKQDFRLEFWRDGRPLDKAEWVPAGAYITVRRLPDIMVAPLEVRLDK